MRFIVIAMLPLLAACASSAAVQPLEGELTIAVRRAEHVPPGEVLLKPLPGGFVGTATGGTVARLRSKNRLNVGSLEEDLSGRALPLRDDAHNPGELASPRGLRLVRLGAFYQPWEKPARCDSFRTGLLADEWPGGMLVYVDRAGSIRGSRYARPWIMEYDLEFPEAGVYLIRTRAHGMVVSQKTAFAGSLVANVRGVGCG